MKNLTEINFSADFSFFRSGTKNETYKEQKTEKIKVRLIQRRKQEAEKVGSMKERGGGENKKGKQDNYTM